MVVIAMKKKNLKNHPQNQREEAVRRPPTATAIDTTPSPEVDDSANATATANTTNYNYNYNYNHNSAIFTTTNKHDYISYGTISTSTSTSTCNNSNSNSNNSLEQVFVSQEITQQKEIITLLQEESSTSTSPKQSLRLLLDGDGDCDDDHDDYNAASSGRSNYDRSGASIEYSDGATRSNSSNNSEDFRTRNTKRSIMVLLRKSLIAVACVYSFYYAVVGLGLGSSRNQNNNSRSNSDNDNNNALSGMFVFDTLFRGVKKKTSIASLESPPPLARSILLVLRAEPTPPNQMVNDLDRQLTAKGIREAEGLGIYLKEHHIPEPDWIFSSPSERTAYTTELIRRNWASDAPVAFEDILYTLEFNDYFSFVAGLNYQFRRVMIVGHNPAILNTAKKLMKTHGIEDFPDCGFLEIRWDDQVDWMTVTPFTGDSKMAVDPNNNFFFSTPR